MASSDANQGLAVFSANYIKRLLERNLYDRIFETEFGQQLKNLDANQRYGIEFGLNLLSVFFDRAIAADSGLKRVVKELGVDAAPEISKRLLNHANSPQERELIRALLALNSDDLTELLRWLGEEPEERDRILRQIRGLSVDQIATIANMESGQRKELMAILAPRRRDWLSDEWVDAFDKKTVEIEKRTAEIELKMARRRERIGKILGWWRLPIRILRRRRGSPDA